MAKNAVRVQPRQILTVTNGGFIPSNLSAIRVSVVVIGE